MKALHLTVVDKIATYQKRDGDIVCGNSDYQVKFAFDSEWDAYSEKVARFIWGGLPPVDIPFTGDTCTVPVIENTDSVEVGVYAGDKDGVDTWELNTTTPATIACRRSILCGGGSLRENEKEYKKSFVSNTFANALKGSASGEALLLDDVSPVEHDVDVKVSGSNIPDFSAVKVIQYSKNIIAPYHEAGYSETINGVTATWLEDGKVLVNGTPNADASFRTSVAFMLKKGFTYTVSGCPRGGSTSKYYFNFQGYPEDVGDGQKIVAGSDFWGIMEIVVKSGITVNNLIFEPMLAIWAGSLPTQYEPYTAPVEYPVNSDGSVDGVRSVYPSMTMMTGAAGAVIECGYNRDLNKAFEKITQAIISIGGNV